MTKLPALIPLPLSALLVETQTTGGMSKEVTGKWARARAKEILKVHQSTMLRLFNRKNPLPSGWDEKRRIAWVANMMRRSTKEFLRLEYKLEDLTREREELLSADHVESGEEDETGMLDGVDELISEVEQALATFVIEEGECAATVWLFHPSYPMRGSTRLATACAYVRVGICVPTAVLTHPVYCIIPRWPTRDGRFQNDPREDAMVSGVACIRDGWCSRS